MTSPPSKASTAVASPADLAASHAYCLHVTRTQARNFYFGLKLLPDQPRRDMFALYAWMRLIDDIADEADNGTPAERLAKLDLWQRDTHRAVAGEAVDGPLWPAFADTVRRRGVPLEILDDAIEGQRQDLQPAPLPDFAALHEYCYRVAGTVGVASLYIWGFDGGEETVALSVRRGVALQLTNVLRDLREDAARDRVYLPEDEMAAAGLTLADLQRGEGGPRFEAFLRSQIARAESYYQSSAALESRVTRSCRRTLATMTEIYHRLLAKISEDPTAILHRRVSLSVWAKLWIAWRTA